MAYVLITGGTSGIGYELARCFASNHFGVILVASNEEGLHRTKGRLEEAFHVPVITFQQDLSQLGAAKKLYTQIREKHLEVEVLVNNAGFGLVGATEEIDFHRDEALIILNVMQLVALCKLFLPDMYRKRQGKILNVASTGAFQPGPYTSTYFASKAFVLSYSRAIRYEAKKRGVSVCTLCPGATKTQFFIQEGMRTPDAAMSPEQVAQYAYTHLMENKGVMVPGMINKLIRMVPVRLKMIGVARMKEKHT